MTWMILLWSHTDADGGDDNTDDGAAILVDYYNFLISKYGGVDTKMQFTEKSVMVPCVFDLSLFK